MGEDDLFKEYFEARATVAAKALLDLATEWNNLPDFLKRQIERNEIMHIKCVIKDWLDEFGIVQSWPDDLHPADVLDKHIFPILKERLTYPKVN